MMSVLRREPVLLGGAILLTTDGIAWLAGVSQDGQAVLHGIFLAWVTLGQRLLSTPRAAAAEAVAAAKAEGADQVAAVKADASEQAAKVEQAAGAAVAKAETVAADQVETAKYVGALEHQALVAAVSPPLPPAKPARAPRARAK